MRQVGAPLSGAPFRVYSRGGKLLSTFDLKSFGNVPS
jgi:hypothetical protein